MEQFEDEVNSNFAVCVIIFTQICMYLPIGITLTSLNPLDRVLSKFVNDSYVLRYGQPSSKSTETLITTIASSSLIWGSLLGAFLYKYVLKYFSRKKAVVFVHVGFLVTYFIMTVPVKYGRSYEALIIGRLLNGLFRGIGFSYVPIYVAEITCRTKFGFYQIPSMICMFVGAGLGLGLAHPKVLGTSERWPWLMSIPAVFSIFYLACLIWLPQTPAYYSRLGDQENAYKTLRRLRNGGDEIVRGELAGIKAEIHNATYLSIMELLRSNYYRKQLFSATIIINTPQLVSLQSMFLYSNQILEEAGIPDSYSTLASMGFFWIIAACCLIGLPIQVKFGTKNMYLGGTIVIFFSLILLMIFAEVQNISTALAYGRIACLSAYAIGVGLGPQPAMFALFSELTTANSRPYILQYSGMLFWLLGSLISFIFPYSLHAIGAYAFLPFVVIIGVILAYVFLLVPDTHNMSHIETPEYFQRNSTAAPQTYEIQTTSNNAL